MPHPYLLTHSVLHRAERNPEAEAFRSGGRALSFGALAERMFQLAGALKELGVQRGDRVGLFLPRCLECAPALYGVLQAGGVYVPLDPTAPPLRLQEVLEDCDIRVLVSVPLMQRRLSALLSQPTPLRAVVGVEAAEGLPTLSWAELESLPAHPSEPHLTEMDLAYIMYTSGSTGKPKGIMHTHASGLAYARLSSELYGLQPEDRVGNHAPLHFDISTFGFFSAPLAGSCTVIVPEAHIRMPASLGALLEAERLTVWYSVPLALVQLLQTGALRGRDLSALRWVLYGGEPFPLKHLRALMSLLPRARFSNVYGPAEVNQCTYHHLQQPPEEDQDVPLGRVWGNTEFRIHDEQDRPVPPGRTGELLIRSATMMQGYWNQPERTRRAFFTLHDGKAPPRTFYRTGDLVRLDERGLLRFVGRKDRQVKIRGHRVELDEVAAALLRHPAVREAAAFPLQLNPENRTIGAAVLLQSHAPTDEPALRKHLAQTLPPYAVPALIRILEEFPRTPTGKIDHRRLGALVQKSLAP